MSRKINSEWKSFVDDGVNAMPSSTISQSILSKVHRDLKPSALQVFSKLMAIHFITSVVTLSFCPQFGFRVLGEGMGLMHVFMKFGDVGCLIACGAFFAGVSLLMAGLILRGEELRKIRDHRWLAIGTLTLLSLGFFIMIDAELVMNLTLAWLIGAMFGSLGALELAWRWRMNQTAYRG